MTATSRVRDREWRQFRLLSRDSVRRLIDTALFSSESDSREFAAWMLALLATPPAFFAARQMLTYTALVNAPEAVVQELALEHRLFFVTYGMLAAALVAALTWETVFPDGRDQEIVGVLPVRPRVFAAARLAAALMVGASCAAVVNVPTAALYSVFAMGHPAFGYNLPGLLTGHAVATVSGSLFVFASLLAVRGTVAVVFGAAAGRWLGAVLQLVIVVLMFEVFFFLPGILGSLVTFVNAGDPRALAMPPVWFAAMHAWVLGDADANLTRAAAMGCVVAASSVVLLVPLYLAPAGWLGRRALESRRGRRMSWLAAAARSITACVRATPATRAVFLFTLASLVRSRRHLIVLASYSGLAVGVGTASILLIEVRGSEKLDVGGSWLLTLPMLLQFFGIAGVRSTFRLPAELEANWPFRLAPPPLHANARAAVLAVVTLVVLPLSIATGVVTSTFWPPAQAWQAAVMQALAGLALAEIMLVRWTRIPYASAHAPSPDLLRAWWPVYALALYLYAFKGGHWQMAALASRRTFVAYVGVALAAILVMRVMARHIQRDARLEFDAGPAHTMERLDLSGSLG